MFLIIENAMETINELKNAALKDIFRFAESLNSIKNKTQIIRFGIMGNIFKPDV
jgi:hypothetical protein